MNINIRKFPYPYKCALAISSDIDNASSVESFVQFMDFLNSEKQTMYGSGLGLEVGNSFWFFNGSNSPQLSYFEGTTEKETAFAPIIRSYLESRHIDTLHSWGNFDNGGFERSYAEIGVRVLKKYNFNIPVWINHGINLNHQKIGDYPNMYGDDPTHPCYHTDLLSECGFEFIWTGKVTHVIGQNSRKNFSTISKLFIQKILKKIKYQHLKDPIYDNDNNLINPLLLRDGDKKWEFIRFINSWGNAGELDLYEFVEQIKTPHLKRLIKNQGVMILYTHFNENVNIMGLPKGLKNNLHFLKQKCESGEIFLTTSSRLLKYKEINDYINFSIEENGKNKKIVISKVLNTPVGSRNIDENQLNGLTFYTDEPETTSIWFENMPISSRINSKDETGRYSVMIPWPKLSYPF